MTLLTGARNYYYLASSLEDLSWGNGVTRGPIDELVDFLEQELHPDDARALRQLFLFNDMRNAVSYQSRDDEFVTPAMYGPDVVLEAGQGHPNMMPFLTDFFENRRRNQRIYPDIPLIDELTLLFYDHLSDIGSAFVRDWYRHELDMRNLTIALSRESHGFPYRERLIPRGEAYRAIMEGSPPDFGLSNDFPYLDELVRVFKTTDLTAQEEAMSRIRWNWLDQRIGAEFFSAEFIFAHVIKYQSAERWQTLSQEKGDEVFGELLNVVRRSVRFALEFSHIGDNDHDNRNSNRDKQQPSDNQK
ncbi:DUF2764 family protein [Salinispira pacifica]